MFSSEPLLFHCKFRRCLLAGSLVSLRLTTTTTARCGRADCDGSAVASQIDSLGQKQMAPHFLVGQRAPRPKWPATIIITFGSLLRSLLSQSRSLAVCLHTGALSSLSLAVISVARQRHRSLRLVFHPVPLAHPIARAFLCVPSRFHSAALTRHSVCE